MNNKKVIVLIPDGVSLRNFAYTSFYRLGIEQCYEIVFWNATPFDLKKLGFPEVKMEKPKLHWLTDILKAATIRIELKLYEKRDSDKIYQGYVFPFSNKSVKSSAKNLLIRFYTKFYGSEKGLKKIRRKIVELERSTDNYGLYKNKLEREKPDFFFCASQRSVTSIAPLTAAQDLKIPTASFIFSWDNVPKATTVVTADFYFVWSNHMMNELLHYQKYIAPKQIKITGTPQFEPHFDKKRLVPREEFFKQHNLSPDATYLCFSGDDITTSPKDELYLRDVATAVRDLNKEGHNIKVIFRRCPVDFSDRYDDILKEFPDVLIDMPPLWKKVGNEWNTILPTPEDLDLQTNIAAHCAAVINLASSMVFDFAAHGKPCFYMNYNYLNKRQEPQKGVYLYDFVHFRSMPSKNAVIWLNSPGEIAEKIENIFQNEKTTVTAAQQWFEKLNVHPPENVSQRIWESISEIIKQP